MNLVITLPLVRLLNQLLSLLVCRRMYRQCSLLQDLREIRLLNRRGSHRLVLLYNPVRFRPHDRQLNLVIALPLVRLLNQLLSLLVCHRKYRQCSLLQSHREIRRRNRQECLGADRPLVQPANPRVNRLPTLLLALHLIPLHNRLVSHHVSLQYNLPGNLRKIPLHNRQIIQVSHRLIVPLSNRHYSLLLCHLGNQRLNPV